MSARRGARLTRRHLLRAGTATLAVPLLPSAFGPGSVRAGADEVPKRFIAIYAPGGIIRGGSFHTVDHWTAGADFARLNEPDHLLHAVRAHKGELIQVVNTRRESFFYGTANGLDPSIGHGGEHPNFLTGSALQANGTQSGWTEIEVDEPSIDHKIADITGHRPLNLGVMPNSSFATLDSISWLNAQQADPWLHDPLAVYTRIFGSPESLSDPERFQAMLTLRRSVLDSVTGERQRFEDTLNAEDRHHLDAYFTNVREAELRLAEVLNASCTIPAGEDYEPVDLTDNAALVVDLALLALECDATRVVTMSTWGAGGGTGGQIAGSYIPGLNEPNRDYHHFTHFATGAGLDPRFDDFQTVSAWSAWSAGYFARFVDGLASRMDVDGSSMLHNSLVMYGSGIGDAAHHQYTDVARVFAGRAGGAVEAGRVIDHGPTQQPAENLLPEILDIFGYRQIDGTPQEVVGLSDGVLSLR